MKTDIKTPTDKRTNECKALIKRVREIKVPYYNTNYGIWAYLRIKDLHDFTNQFNNFLN